MSKENKSADYIIKQLAQARKIIDNCVELLSAAPPITRKFVGKTVQKKTRPQLNLALNERNFIRTYGKGLSGPKKFVLLLAREVKGKVGTEVKLDILRTKWNKMTAKGLMGYQFNLFYPNDAKTRGWIDSKKNGNVPPL
jgi:hypothetical protein